MSKRKQGGTNNTRPKKCSIIRKPMQYAEGLQLYGRVEKELGCCRFHVITLNDDKVVALLQGTVKKQAKLLKDHIVLIESLEDNIYRIVFHYTPEQQKTLVKEGRLKKIEDPTKKDEIVNSVVNKMDDFSIEDDGFYFEGEKEARAEQTLVIDEDFIDLI